MATTNDSPFNSLDPLGPEYGRINAPISDSMGLSAFEGDKINAPKINFPGEEKVVPIMPNLGNLDNPTQQIRNNVVGNPPGKQGLNKKARYNQLAQSMDAYARNMMKANQDQNQYAKIYSYDAGPASNAFYKRYNAYGQEKFDQIGFSPLRDNEALFNARTTGWDDASRMLTNSFIPLFTRGFVSAPKSLGKMLKGDFTGTDLEDAAAYEESAAIGQSTKGGAVGFISNAAMNFAYSAGIITEAVTEEVALAALTVGTEGGAAPALFARTAMNLKRVANSFKGLKLTNLATDGMRAINKTLDAVNSVQGARQFWNATKGIATKINPLSNTFDAYKLANQADNFTNLGRAYKTAGGFYRDVRNINMALSEARLEAGMVENHIYDNLYNEYYAKNGKPPEDGTQHDMIKQAKKGSINTLYWNAGLIYGSNLITFPNIVGPKGGIRNFTKTTLRELSDVSAGKFGKLGKVVYDQTKKKFAFEKNNFVNYVKGWAKNPIHKSIGNTVGYFKSNFTEGIQENLQEVIGGANERYYTDTFQSKAVQSHNYSKAVSQFDYMGDELGKQFSAQGFETFASGFVMGTFAAPLNKGFEYLGIGYNRMFDKEGYQKLKDKKLEITKDLINNLNGIDVKEFLNSKMFNYGRQDIISKIKTSGDKKEAMDADHEALLEQTDMLLRNGSFDSFKEKLLDLQDLTPEEFEDNVPTVPKGEGAKYQMKINDTVDKMDRINKRYQTYKEKFQNPIDPENLPPKGTPEYQNAVTLHNAWEESTKNAVFFNETFEDTMRRKKDILQKFNSQKPLQSLTQRDSEVIFDHDKLRNEVGLLKNEIESLKGLKDPASREDLNKKERKLAAMQKLGESSVNFTNFFNRYERSGEIRAALQKEKGDVPVTDEEVEAVMDEYFGEFSDDNKIDNVSKYETSFKEYLRAVADVNKDYLFDEKVDEAFQLLADHHKLDSESRALIKGVNLLHDPAGFLDLVERNQKWMKDLYARRGEYYQKMITDQFDVVVDNALLNALANKSIYISLDDFAAWKNEGIPPSEFYDHARKLVIPEGTEDYDMYYMFFEQAAQLKAEKSGTVPSSLDQNLRDDLEKLDAQKEKELDNVPKIETRVPQGKLEPNKSGNITAKMIQEQLKPNMYAEADYGAEDKIVLFMDEVGVLKEDNKDGAEVDVESIPLSFQVVETYTIQEKADPAYAAQIEKKYEELKEDRIRQYTEQVEDLEKKEKEQNVQEFEPITSDTQIEEIAKRSPVLYNNLNKEFNERVIKKMDSEEYVNMTPEQERNLFEKFIQSDQTAKELIDKYNKEQKLDSVTKETGEKEEFEFMYQGKMVKTADLKTIQDLEKMKRRFDKMIKDIADNIEPTTEDMTNKSKYSIVSKDLEKLINTRTKAENTVEKDITAAEYTDFIDNGVVKAGRITKIAEKIKNGTDLTQQEKEIFQDKTTEINEELRKMSEKDAAKAKPSDIEVNTAGPKLGFQTFNVPISKKEDIANVVAGPLVPASEIFWDKNIRTTGSWIEVIQGKADGEDYIEIAYDSLSEENKKIANKLKDSDTNFGGFKGVRIVLGNNLSAEEAQRKAIEIANKFKQQDLLWYSPVTLQNTINSLEADKKRFPNSAKEIDQEIERVKDTWGKELSAGEYFDKATQTIWASKELYNKSKGVSTLDIEAQRADIEKRRMADIKEYYKQDFTGKTKSIQELEKELQDINAKYNAELAALEQATTKPAETERVNIEKGLEIDGVIPKYGEHKSAIPTLTEILYDENGNKIGQKEYVGEEEVNAAQARGVVGARGNKAAAIRTRTKAVKIGNKNYKADIELYPDGTAIYTISEVNTGGIVVKTLSESEYTEELAALENKVKEPADTIPENPESSDDVNSPTQDPASRKEEVIDDAKRYSIDNFKADLAKVKTIEELQQVLGDLNIKVTEEAVAFEDLQVMSELAKQKAEDIKAGNVKIDPIALVEGTQLIAKEITFDDSKMFAMTGDTIVVRSVDKAGKKIVITPLGSTEEMTISFGELNEMFILKDTAMDTTEQVTTPVTKEEKDMVNQSSDLADTILNSPDQLTELEKTVSNKTIKELDSELLEDLKC